MSLEPLVPRSNDPRSDVPRNEGSRGLLPGETAEFIRPFGSALYNVLPAQESTLREYMRVLIKRKWLVISVVAGIFMAVAVASLRQTPVYDAVGRIADQQSRFAPHCSKTRRRTPTMFTSRAIWIPRSASCKAI
jgi:hypothetical protein